MSDIAELVQTVFKVFEGQSGVPITLARPGLGMAYAIPGGAEATVAGDYAPWTGAEVRQVFYRETLLGAVGVEAVMVMRWRFSAGQQYIINCNFAVNVRQQDPTVDMTVEVAFDTPSPYDVELEAYEIPFHATIVYDAVGGDSTTVLDGVVRADGTGSFNAES